MILRALSQNNWNIQSNWKAISLFLLTIVIIFNVYEIAIISAIWGSIAIYLFFRKDWIMEDLIVQDENFNFIRRKEHYTRN